MIILPMTDTDKKHLKIKERSLQQLQSLEERNKGRNLRKQKKKEARKIIENFINAFPSADIYRQLRMSLRNLCR